MSQQSNNALDGLKSGIKGIHGIGEQIRGTLNQAVDATFHEPEGEAKNRAIAEKGEQDVRNAANTFDHPKSGGVTTGGVSQTGVPQSQSGQTTAAGTHAGAVGNLGDTTTTGPTQGLGSTGQRDAVGQEDASTNARY